MPIDTYSVWCGNELLADSMSRENALIFVDGLFRKFWNETAAYTIKKNVPHEENCTVRRGGDICG